MAVKRYDILCTHYLYQHNTSIFWTSITTKASKSPISELHIKLLELFKGFRTFANFIKPFPPKKQTEQPDT